MFNFDSLDLNFIKGKVITAIHDCKNSIEFRFTTGTVTVTDPADISAIQQIIHACKKRGFPAYNMHCYFEYLADNPDEYLRETVSYLSIN